MIHFLTSILYASLLGSPNSVPATVVVATSRGEAAIPVAADRGHPAIPAPALAELLPVSSRHAPDWAVVFFAEQPFRFPIGAPAFIYQNQLMPLAGGAYINSDTLYVPLQWLAQYIPQIFHEAYRWDPLAARFEESHMPSVVTDVARSVDRATPRDVTEDVPEAATRLGLRRLHKVVVDAGHGGRQPGSPGRYLPRGVKEKHVTLAIAHLLRAELERRGIEVVMTRTDDSFVPLLERAPMCRADCDLFVSLHVNSVRNRRDIRGLETYFFEEARTADAARVAAVENEDLRYEADATRGDDDPIAFIMKDLQRNEYLRESALLADLVHNRTAQVHPGGSRRVAQANFVVLRVARRPAILVETGYGTNPSDARFLASEQGQRKLARAIAEGIVEYLLRYEGKIAESFPQ
jgi:N-acetylmuramoyl-L-alanine amidase